MFGYISHDINELDGQISYFIELAWTEGEPKWLVGDLLSGASYFLNRRRILSGSWKLFSIWDGMEMSTQARPLPVGALFAVCGFFVQAGKHRAALSSFVAFSCLLRTGEMLTMAWHHIVAGSSEWVLSLPDTKGGKRKRCLDKVTIDDPAVQRLLASFAHSAQPMDRLLDLSGPAFRNLWSNAMNALELSSFGMKPYSLRRGGATFDFKAHGNLDRTVVRGRWESQKIARIYIQGGSEALTKLQLSDTARLRIAEYGGIWRSFMQSSI